MRYITYLLTSENICDMMPPNNKRIVMEEVWKEIPSHKNYEVSNLGSVRHKRGVFNRRWNGGRILKPLLSKGYPSVCLYDLGQSYKNIHALVAEAFIGPRPYNREVDHEDFDKSNNNSDNLRYISHARNMWRAPLHNRPGRRRSQKIVAEA